MYGYFNRKELLRIGFGSIGKNVMVSRAVELVNVSKIFIGDNSRIDTFAIIAPSGNAVFSLGKNVHICAYTLLNGLESITFEDFTSIGPHGTILSSCDNFSGDFFTNATIEKKYLGTFSAPVIIKKHAVIATAVTILPGVTIAEGTVVGAHSLVKKGTKPYTVVGGVPARKLKKRSMFVLDIEKRILGK